MSCPHITHAKFRNIRLRKAITLVPIPQCSQLKKNTIKRDRAHGKRHSKTTCSAIYASFFSPSQPMHRNVVSTRDWSRYRRSFNTILRIAVTYWGVIFVVCLDRFLFTLGFLPFPPKYKMHRVGAENERTLETIETLEFANAVVSLD